MAENRKAQPPQHVSGTRTNSVSSAKNHGFHSHRSPSVSSDLSRVQNKRKQTAEKRSEESINYTRHNNFVVAQQFGNLACSQLTFQYPFNCYNNNLAYRNYSQAVFQQNLSYACFHRPESSNQRQVHNSAINDQRHQKNLRIWDKVSSNDNMRGFRFSVMSYNVLAQDLVSQHPYLYRLHNQHHLNWNFRWNNLLQEITRTSPDILCLQEVQGSHLSTFYSQLNTLGYEGLYKQRTGVRTDGCAIYYKKHLIKLIEHTTVEYNQPNVQLLDRDNVAIIAKFAPQKHPTSEFVVATTHLLYNPKRQDVRLAQTQLLLTEVDRLAFRERDSYNPVILTGDLNSTPDSAVYKFITKGSLKYEHLASRSLLDDTSRLKVGKEFLPPNLKITDQCQHADLLPIRENNGVLPRSEELKLIEIKHSERSESHMFKNERKEYDKSLFASGTLSHKFSLQSVYKHGSRDNPEGTTFQDEWITVDYIFYSKLSLLERYKIPNRKQLDQLRIPNETQGSDHLCLIAKFNLEV